MDKCRRSSDRDLLTVLERISSLEEKIASSDRLMQVNFASQEKSVNTALVASDRAIQKAEMASEKRFDSVNEFRGQLKDQAATFIGRAEHDQRYNSLHEKIDSLNQRMDKLEGTGRGLGIGWGFIIGAIGVLSAILALWRR